MPRIKICGLSTEATLDVALDAGADMVGFVFVGKSPRNVSVERAADLRRRLPGDVEAVALLVEPDDALIGAVVERVRPDHLQLHGRESPERVAAIRARFDVPVIKAIGIASRADLAALAAYRDVADRLLLDAKPPPAAAYPGGHGRPFDWSILAPASGALDPKTLDPAPAFMLSGGLSDENVAEAIRRTNPWGVDVSSGVERAPGVKDPDRIAAFVRAARGAHRPEARKPA